MRIPSTELNLIEANQSLLIPLLDLSLDVQMSIATIRCRQDHRRGHRRGGSHHRQEGF